MVTIQPFNLMILISSTIEAQHSSQQVPQPSLVASLTRAEVLVENVLNNIVS